MEHVLTTYIRTKTVFKGRLKDLKDYENVRIYQYELNKLLRMPKERQGNLLHDLLKRGEIWYDESKTEKQPWDKEYTKDITKGDFRAVRGGRIEPGLLEVTRKREKAKMPLKPLHLYMRDQLMHVELDIDQSEMPVYFKAFLEHRQTDLDAFFTVDAFSHRVHSPIVNLKGDLRSKLRFYGGPVTSLDVKQMQPTILAKVLIGAVGENPFSTAIFNGEDVYEHLMKQNPSIENRDAAKKFLFRLIFGKPMTELGTMFEGDNRWVDWINDYKSRTEELNPHKDEKHTNLAWLLQFSEVQVMTDIWNQLHRQGVPFLTIHDDILCRKKDRDIVYKIMDEELKKHFKKYSIVTDHHTK